MSRRGVVVWITGLPSSGKSTLAHALAERARAEDEPVIVLDGDEVRAALRPAPGYDDASRDAFYETLARLAALSARQGLLVIVPATAHRRAYRERARALAPAYVEVLVDTPIEECARRDAKGLYARAAAGDASARAVPGVGVELERSDAVDAIVHPEADDPVPHLLSLARRARVAS